MPPTLGAATVTNAASILASTNFGLTGPQIVEVCSAYASDWNVELPHQRYPFANIVPNKRTALSDNVMAFSEAQRYTILRNLCDHDSCAGRDDVKQLKLRLIARFGHLAGEDLGTEVDQELIERTKHWLGPFQAALNPYQEAIQKHANKIFLRNVLDDLRLSLELLLKALLENDRSLENQIAQLGTFIKERGGSTELSNMFVKLVDYYTKYQNSYVKHDDAVVEEEVEFMIELTSSFMKHLVRLSYRAAD